ncbi:hypothetical protein TWF106_010692 [Orbilia oligospora]|uniref:Uncharacterized protein n=1 Tax=Orbilia oligospora TaxID=2813651 RepID=A0A7C8QGQ3_ORBOL|nr:hypothetical protein TWF106_010692 [Orbilia oligospora]
METIFFYQAIFGKNTETGKAQWLPLYNPYENWLSYVTQALDVPESNHPSPEDDPSGGLATQINVPATIPIYGKILLHVGDGATSEQIDESAYPAVRISDLDSYEDFIKSVHGKLSEDIDAIVQFFLGD